MTIHSRQNEQVASIQQLSSDCRLIVANLFLITVFDCSFGHEYDDGDDGAMRKWIICDQNITR